MPLPNSGLTLVVLAALAVAGCQSSRVSSLSTRPEPLTPAPSGAVVAGQLPPPLPPTAPTDPAAFPPPPGAGTQVAAVDPAAPAEPVVPAGAPDLTAGSVAGVWNASVAGQSCRIATPQTRFGQGFRAGPLRCPAPLDGVKSWSVTGKQLALYDEGGNTIARLYSSGAERFDGQTTGGQPISLTR